MFKGLLNLIFASKTPKSSLKNRNKRKSKTKDKAERISDVSFAPTASGGSGLPKILIADIEGDGGEDIASRIATCLNGFQSYEIFRTKQVLKLGEKGGFADQLSEAAEQGRDCMYDAQADLLVWGRTLEGRIELRFLAMTPLSDGKPGAFGLGDALILPPFLQAPWYPFFTGRC